MTPDELLSLPDSVLTRKGSITLWIKELLRDETCRQTTQTAAFRRLHDISFLGALDYTSPTHSPRKERSRAEHSLHVAALANYVAHARHYDDDLRRHLVIAALLHDIGHPPLSHSAEPALKSRFGHGHHEAGERVIRGEVAIGQELSALLGQRVDVSFILDLLDQRVAEDQGGDLFASPINIDTIDGIARSLACLAPGARPLPVLSIAQAAFLEQPRSSSALLTLDNFWVAKQRTYAQFIQQPLGILSDQASQHFLAECLAESDLAEEDFFSSETAWQAKYPALFDGLAQIRNDEIPPWLAARQFEITARSYFIDANQPFAERYRLALHRETLQIPSHQPLQPPLAARSGGAVGYRDVLQRYPHLRQSWSHSAHVMHRIGQELAELLAGSPRKELITIVCTGSYGRDEACPASDLDYFMLLEGCGDEDIAEEKAIIKEVIASHIPRSNGDAGFFGHDATQDFATLLEHIGGPLDSNQSLTRRMLLLLEGKCLYGEERFDGLRRRLLETYIAKGSRDKAISRFLLNDVIRYYRTITTDFQHKVDIDRKAWGLRNIKLRFSRKILYFAGIMAIAETAGEPTKEARIARMLGLLALPPLQRIHFLAHSEGPPCAELADRTAEIFEIYEFFLAQISAPQRRQELENLGEEHREDSALYMALHQSSKRFSASLYEWIRVKYPADHPIHNALVF